MKKNFWPRLDQWFAVLHTSLAVFSTTTVHVRPSFLRHELMKWPVRSQVPQTVSQ